MERLLKNHIVSNSKICGGKPCVAGTRIRVQDVYVWHELRGKLPDEIVADYPQLSLADVHAALAYFWDHREEVLAQIREDDESLKSLKAETGPGPLERRLSDEQADGDHVSSG